MTKCCDKGFLDDVAFGRIPFDQNLINFPVFKSLYT